MYISFSYHGVTIPYELKTRVYGILPVATMNHKVKANILLRIQHLLFIQCHPLTAVQFGPWYVCVCQRYCGSGFKTPSL